MTQLNQIILPEEIKVRNYKILIPGITLVTITEFDDLAEKIRTATMPDQTRRSGGTTEPLESSFSVPMHHKVETAALDTYYELCRAALPGYKRDSTLTYFSASGLNSQGYMLAGLFITGRTLPGGKLDDEGAMAAIKYDISVDEIFKI